MRTGIYICVYIYVARLQNAWSQVRMTNHMVGYIVFLGDEINSTNHCMYLLDFFIIIITFHRGTELLQVCS